MSASTPALRVANLRKAYGDVVAVDGLDLDVRAAQCFGLLGPNGAGKTTTIEICEGLTEADSGEVELLGLRWSTDAKQLRQRLGIQLQDTQLADKLTVLETVTLFRSFYQKGPAPAEVIAVVQLEDKRGAESSRCRAARSRAGCGVSHRARRGAQGGGHRSRDSGGAARRAGAGRGGAGRRGGRQRFPDAVRPFISALPLTALNDALRAHMLRGAGLVDVAPQLGVLAAWLVVCFAIALKVFRWR